MAKRYRSSATRIVAIACFSLSFFLAPIAEAACTGDPPTIPMFYGDRGQLDRPFVVPGDHAGGGSWVSNGGRVTLTLASCPPAPPPPDFDLQNHVVALVFTPPGTGQRNALLWAANCTAADEQACSGQLGLGGVAKCAKNAFQVTGDNRSLFFDVPATTSVGLPDLTGPATIVVTTRPNPRCDLGGPIPNCKAAALQNPPPVFCVDDLHQAPCSPTAHPVFGNFTVLPELNDYKSLCRDKGDKPSCASAGLPLRLAVDKRGNALIPIKWVGVVKGPGGPDAPCQPSPIDDSGCSRRKFAGYTGINAFPGNTAPINLPAGDVTSYNMRGAKFNIAITASQTDDKLELRLDGVAHKPKSVLRLPSGTNGGPPNQFFNFADRMQGGVGSVLLGQSGGPGVCSTASGADEDPPTGPRQRCNSDGECGAGRVCAGFRGFARDYE
jgi:hypothetical protein